MNESIGKNIKKYRKIKGLTQLELAKDINKTTRMIQKYESGEVTPSIKIIEDISKKLEVNLLNLAGSGFQETLYIPEYEDDSLQIDDVIKSSYEMFTEFIALEYEDHYLQLSSRQLEDLYIETKEFIEYKFHKYKNK